MKRATKQTVSSGPGVCGISEQESEQRILRILSEAMLAWRPPPKLSLSEWADRYYRLSAESAAEPGTWHTLPYQRGIMDAVTDPRVEKISVQKSARVGFTLSMCAAIGYHMHQDPTTIMVVQPTVDAAETFSKDMISSMLRDVPVLSQIVFRDADEGPKKSANTILNKSFPGGLLSLVGANSGAGFRSVSRRILLFDEVDCYPETAGSEGDPIDLGVKRTQAFWNRKIIAGSTPLIAGSSRIAKLFESGDQRRYYVPCPHCGAMDFLTFSEGVRGHWMAWPKDEPRKAHFICRANGCVIEHKSKREMVERGEWRADAEFHGHASFHIWAAYSYSPNATWRHIAEEFLAANKAGPLHLQTFVNTTLGETWTEKGEAPDWQRLYQRREHYVVGTVPAEVVLLTCGVDVQRDRLVFEVVGWGSDRQSWSVDAGVLPGSPAGEEVWKGLDELLARSWPGADGSPSKSIGVLAVDSGDQTQAVYGWARRYPMSRVIAVKGVGSAKALIGSPSAVDLKANGKRLARGYKVWPVSGAIAKSEFYGWLNLEAPLDATLPFPPGWCHFPEHGEDYFKQITAEHLVPVRKRGGYTAYEWQCQPNRENHWLDARLYARAAAHRAGLDRYAADRRRKEEPAAQRAPVQTTPAPQASTPAQATPPAPPREPAEQPAPMPQRRPGGWLQGGGRRPGGWLGRR